MLIRKMLREMKANPGQFISVLILAFLATFIYSGFEANVVGSRRAVESFHEACHIADAWIYSEGFTEENLEAVRKLDCVEEAQLRTEFTGTTPSFDGAQTDFYLMEESLLLTPWLYQGEDNRLKEADSLAFDPEDTEGVWLNWSFANARNICVGDSIELEYRGFTFTRTIRGLIMEPEYEYTKAEKDADTNFSNLAYVYMGYAALPEIEVLGMTCEARDFLPYTTMLVTFTEEARADAADRLKKEKSRLSIPLSFESEIAGAVGQNYAVMIDEKSVPGIQRVASELEQHDSFSYVFAIVFLIVAILVISTTMSRLVQRQRTQIGTLNALGMKPVKIALHYVGYSFFVAAIGAVLGLILGPLVIGRLIIDMVMEWYMVPHVAAGTNAMFYVITLIVILACVLASFLSCFKLLRMAPATALRPAAPKKARRILAERLPFWNRLSFTTQYNLRDVARAPMRALMGIVGTMIGTVLVIYAFGCYFLVGDIVEWNFDKIMNYDYQMVLSQTESIEAYDDLAGQVEGELIMTEVIELSAVEKPTALEKSKQTLTVIEGKGLMNITDEKTAVTKLTPGRVAVTSRLASSLGLKVGDLVYWHIYSRNEWHASTIGLINRTPETAGITMLREDLEAEGLSFMPSMIVTKKDVSGYDRDHSGVSAVNDMAKIREAFIEGYRVIIYLFVLMMAFSVITVIVVLYNSGNLSFFERLKEFATLKVLGLSTAKVRRILNRENIWFAVAGILLGLPLGKPTLLAMMNSNGDNFDYYVTVPAFLYILAGLFILALAVLVSHMFSKKIRSLDLAETLKGLE